MDNHQTSHSLNTAWSTAQLEQLRRFLQTASQIPSANSIQEALHPKSLLPSQQSTLSQPRNQTIHLAPTQKPKVFQTARSNPSSFPRNQLNLPVPDGVSGLKYPEPSFKSMVFDPGTGYRFDQSTGLHYDANAGLFVNKQSNLLLRWNPLINSYTLVGRATDISTPLLANDLARLMEQRQTACVSTFTQNPKKESPFPSVSSHGRDPDFGGMSPNHQEVVASIPSLTGNPSDKKYDPIDSSSSWSFDEMTPERDDDTFDDYPIVKDSSGDKVCTGTNRSQDKECLRSLPSHEEKSSRLSGRRDYSLSPGRRGSAEQYLEHPPDSYSKRRHSRSPGYSIRSYSSDRNKSKRSSERCHSPSWDSRSSVRRSNQSRRSEERRRGYSSSPGGRGSAEQYLKHPSDSDSKRRRSRSPGYSIKSYSSDWNKSKRGSERCHGPSWDSRSSARRSGPSRRSEERIRGTEREEMRSGTSRRRRRSPSQDSRRRDSDRTTPIRTSPRGSSPQKRPRTSPSRDALRDMRRRSSIRKSPSPRKQCDSRLEDGHTGRGLHPRGKRSRSKSRSRGRRSTSAPKFETKLENNGIANQSRNSKSPNSDTPPRRHDNEDTSSLLVKNPQVDQAPYSSQSKSKDDTTKTTQKASNRFVAQINKIHKHNLGNPGNKFSHLFPHPVRTAFLMLSPLPHKGDREWEDLEILLNGILTEKDVDFHSAAVFPGDGGAPCNYALLRFKTYEAAGRWYISQEGTIDLAGPDGSMCTVFMNFMQNNWTCKTCKTLNFAVRSFCYKCFRYVNRNKSPIQVSQLVTRWVGIAGLDCRLWEIEEVLAGLPPLNSFDIETYELLMENNRIPIGLCVFKFRTSEESAAFFTYLRESCVNPIFVDIVDRVKLEFKPVLGHLLKTTPPVGSAQADSSVPASSAVGENKDYAQKACESVVFQSPPITDPENNPLLWWRDVQGYVPEEGNHLMLRYLFDEHPDTALSFEYTPAQVFIGPLPIPEKCDLIEFRDQFSRFLQTVGISPKVTERTAFFLAHLFGAPFSYSLIRFESKDQGKIWFDEYDGKLAITLENGLKWPLYIHFTKSNWSCDDCHKWNFHLRVQCFFCYKPRTSDYTPVTIKKSPTACIGITGFQNWCASKELLLKKLPFLQDVKDLEISYMKEPSGIPLGICVLKSPTLTASEILYNKMQGALSNEIARTNVKEPNRPLLVYVL